MTYFGHLHLAITGDAGGDWFSLRTPAGWVLAEAAASPPDATVTLDQETAWRLFTRGISKGDASKVARLEGDQPLATKVLDMVSIIA